MERRIADMDAFVSDALQRNLRMIEEEMCKGCVDIQSDIREVVEVSQTLRQGIYRNNISSCLKAELKFPTWLHRETRSITPHPDLGFTLLVPPPGRPRVR